MPLQTERFPTRLLVLAAPALLAVAVVVSGCSKQLEYPKEGPAKEETGNAPEVVATPPAEAIQVPVPEPTTDDPTAPELPTMVDSSVEDAEDSNTDDSTAGEVDLDDFFGDRPAPKPTAETPPAATGSSSGASFGDFLAESTGDSSPEKDPTPSDPSPLAPLPDAPPATPVEPKAPTPLMEIPPLPPTAPVVEDSAYHPLAPVEPDGPPQSPIPEPPEAKSPLPVPPELAAELPEPPTAKIEPEDSERKEPEPKAPEWSSERPMLPPLPPEPTAPIEPNPDPMPKPAEDPDPVSVAPRDTAPAIRPKRPTLNAENTRRLAWVLGAKLSLAVVPESKIEAWEPGAVAEMLGLPAVPIDSSGGVPAATARLLKVSSELGRLLSKAKGPDHAALLEIAVKSNAIAALYETHPKLAKPVADAIEKAVPRSGLDAKLCGTLIGKLRSGAQSSEVRNAVFALHEAVERELSKPQD